MATATSGEEEDNTYHRGSSGAREWIKAILDLAENEHAILSNMLRSLNPPSSNATIASTFSRLIHPILRHFSTTMSTVHALIKQDLSSQMIFIFDLIATLSELVMRWNGVIVNPAGKANEESGGLEGGAHALQDQLQALRSTAVNIFPVFLNDLKGIPKQRETEVPSVSINEITYMGLSFMKEACEYADTIAPLLATLGAGNWIMSGSMATTTAQSAGMSEPSVMFSQFICDTLSTTIAALDGMCLGTRAWHCNLKRYIC
jgi:exocyst complex protein 7